MSCSNKFTEFIAFTIKNTDNNDTLKLSSLQNNNYWDDSAKTLYVESIGMNSFSDLIQDIILVSKNNHFQSVKGSYNVDNTSTLLSDDILIYDNNIYNLISKDHIGAYEEVADYSLLNVITEEIFNIDNNLYDKNLQQIMANSLGVPINYQNNNDSSNINIENVINNFLDSNKYQVFLHNFEEISYLEIIDNNDNQVYNMCINGDHLYNIDTEYLDNMITYAISNNKT